MNNNPALRYGLIYAGITIAYYSVLYFIDKKLLFSFIAVTAPLFILGIVLMVMAARKERDLDADGMLSYGDAVKVTFIVQLIQAAAVIIFTYILFAVDSEMPMAMKEATMDTASNMMSIFGADESVMDEVQKEMPDDAFNFTTGSAIIGFVGSLVSSIVISLIVAIFVKRTD